MNAVISGSAPDRAEVAAASPWWGEAHASTAAPQASRNVAILCRFMRSPCHSIVLQEPFGALPQRRRDVAAVDSQNRTGCLAGEGQGHESIGHVLRMDLAA